VVASFASLALLRLVCCAGTAGFRITIGAGAGVWRARAQPIQMETVIAITAMFPAVFHYYFGAIGASRLFTVGTFTLPALPTSTY
jgi:hypothetical protein